MTELTGSLAVVTQAYYDLITMNQEALGIKAVYYGDQDNIPTTPAACVEPDSKNRQLVRVGRGTDVNFILYVILYHSSIREPQSNRRDADQLADAVEALIHDHEQLKDTLGNPIVVSSLVTSIESGYSTKGNSIMRASRLMVEARSQERLPLGT